MCLANSEDYYFLFGRLIALSVIHGGPGPRCFSRFLYDQILKKPRTYLLSLITASPVHELIAKVSLFFFALIDSNCCVSVVTVFMACTVQYSLNLF